MQDKNVRLREMCHTWRHISLSLVSLVFSILCSGSGTVHLMQSVNIVNSLFGLGGLHLPPMVWLLTIVNIYFFLPPLSFFFSLLCIAFHPLWVVRGSWFLGCYPRMAKYTFETMYNAPPLLQVFVHFFYEHVYSQHLVAAAWTNPMVDYIFKVCVK